MKISFWVPERPASFRNASDARWWRECIQDVVADDHRWEEELTGTPLVEQPSADALKLEVLHLHAGGTLRDVDNTAKPIMDAFNGRLYRDDKQIRDLSFRSLKFDCEAAHMALQTDNGFARFLRNAVHQAQAQGRTIDHLTFVSFSSIEARMNDTLEERVNAVLSWWEVRKAFE